MKKLTLLLILFLQIAVYAQVKTVDIDKEDPNKVASTAFFIAGGFPVSTTKYISIVSGTAYFNEAWTKGRVVLSEGKMIDSLTIRLDLLASELQYKTPEGAQMIAATPIRNVIIIDPNTGKEYSFIKSEYMSPAPADAGWYQLLTTGNATLYKRIGKKIMETKAYASSVTEQNIVTLEQYYVLTNGVYTKVKKVKELPDVLVNKSSDLTSYISSRKLSGKTDQDYVDVVVQYNTLLQK